MIQINILADAKFPFERTELRKHLINVLAKYRLTDGVECHVWVVGKRKMAELHQQYMNLPGPTDVLSFPLSETGVTTPFVSPPDGLLHLGDIVVCYTEAKKQALEKQVKIDTQIKFLAEHGLMHLLGFHHE